MDMDIDSSPAPFAPIPSSSLSRPSMSTSRPSTSTSTPRPSSAGVTLPSIRSLPGFQMQSEGHGPVGGRGSMSFDPVGADRERERGWSVTDREREALRERELRERELRERDWESRERERERDLREREREMRGAYDGYSTARGKERELSLPMPMLPQPISRPASISRPPSSSMSLDARPLSRPSSSSAAMLVDDRPLSRAYTTSSTLNNILGMPSLEDSENDRAYGRGRGVREEQPYQLPISRGSMESPLPVSRGSMASPSPFAHSAGSGLPPIGHGLLAAGRREVGIGVGREVAMNGAGGSARWGMSPPISARSPPVASTSTSAAGSSSLAHLYSVASAAAPYPTSNSTSRPTSRPSSSHAPSTSASISGQRTNTNGYGYGLHGYGYGRSRTDSDASASTHISSATSAGTSASGSMTPTNHHHHHQRVSMPPPSPVPLSPAPASVSPRVSSSVASTSALSRQISHPRPQAYVLQSQAQAQRALMSPPPVPESRHQQPSLQHQHHTHQHSNQHHQHQHQHPDQHVQRRMSPPAPASTPIQVLLAPEEMPRRGNVNPYLAARDGLVSRGNLQQRDVASTPPQPVVRNGSVSVSVASASKEKEMQVVQPDRYREEVERKVGRVVEGMAEAARDRGREAERVLEQERPKENEESRIRRHREEEPTTKEALRMDVDVEMETEEAKLESRTRSSPRIEPLPSFLGAPSVATLEVPPASTPKTRNDMLRPPSSSPLPNLLPSLPLSAPVSPTTRPSASPSALRTPKTQQLAGLSLSPRPSIPSSVPVQEKESITVVAPPDTLVPDESIQCICGISIDDGFSIACDVCSRWCHMACFRISQESVPEEWVCWVCAGGSNGGLTVNGHGAGGGKGKGRGKGRGAGHANANGHAMVGRQWTPWTKDEVEERRVWARQMQMTRLGLVEGPDGSFVRASGSGFGAGGGGGGILPSHDMPGVAATGKRKRRASAAPPFQQHHDAAGSSVSGQAHDVTVGGGVDGPNTAGGSAAAGANGEEEDEEPWTSMYVSIPQDVITDPETRARLRKHAQRWRGVSALADDDHDDGMDVDEHGGASHRPVRVDAFPDPDAPNVTVRPLAPLSRRNGASYGGDASSSTPNLDGNVPLPPSSSQTLTAASFAYNPLVLPPTYGLHTTSHIPSKSLIAPFVSHITPSSTYISDPLNAYVHLGMPKPYVHLLGPPLEVALDARGVGGKARFARRGCWPNAVLRPVLCDNSSTAKAKGKQRAADHSEDDDEDGTQLAFGVFALRDLKAGEEVVLGWEWDDGHVVHKLPALLQTPSVVNPAQVPHIKDQMANLLHALASNFVACACGARVQLGEGCTGHHEYDDPRAYSHGPHPNLELSELDSDTDMHYANVDVYEGEERGRTRERLSARERRIRQKEQQRVCAMASMARFVGQDDHPECSSADENAAYSPREFGPLIGTDARRGFKTGGKMRRGPGYGGGASTYVGRGDWERSWQNGDKVDGNASMQRYRDGANLRTEAGMVMQASTSDRYTASPPVSVRIGNPRFHGKDDKRVKERNGAALPPKMLMRKRWTQSIAPSVGEPAGDVATSGGRETAAITVDYPQPSQTEREGLVGLGIRFEVPQLPEPEVEVASTRGTQPTSLPPPTLPTVHGTSAVGHVSSPSPPASMLNPSWSGHMPRSPPRSPGSPLVSSMRSPPRRKSASSDGQTLTPAPTPPPTELALLAHSQRALASTALTNSPSPLVSFANLSLLSPAVLSQVHKQTSDEGFGRSSVPLPSSLSAPSYFPEVTSTSPTSAPSTGSRHHSPAQTSSPQRLDGNTIRQLSPPLSLPQPIEDDKVWSPLQRRFDEQTDESRGAPEIAPDASTVKDLDFSETCEPGARIEYSGTAVASTHQPSCTPVDVGLDTEDVDMHLPSESPLSRLSTPETSVAAEPASGGVELSSDEEAAQSAEPEGEPQTDESEDMEVPSHRWRRKRKRIVSMDSEPGGRSQSPPYKVARESALDGVDVHMSPRPMRRQSTPMSRVLTGPKQEDEDTIMENASAEQEGPQPESTSSAPPDVAAMITSERTPEVATLKDDEPMVLEEDRAANFCPAEPHSDVAHQGTPELVEEPAPSAATLVSAPEPSPQPEAPRKVKLSLADFARRKKQQRQEEERQLELQRALNPPPPPQAPSAGTIPDLPLADAVTQSSDQLPDRNALDGASQRQSPSRHGSSTPAPSDAVRNVPKSQAIAVETISVNGKALIDPSPVPSPMSVSPEETVPPVLNFVATTAENMPRSPSPAPTLPAHDLQSLRPTEKPVEFQSPFSKSDSSNNSDSSHDPELINSAPPMNEDEDRHPKQERVEAPLPPPPSGKPSRFGPPLTRSLVGSVAHPPSVNGISSNGRIASTAERIQTPILLQEKAALAPHARRLSQSQEDGEIRENIPPASALPISQLPKPVRDKFSLPDPPSDPKDLKGWNQYYREVYNLTGSFDPPGVAVRPGMHPPPKGPRGLIQKGEPIGALNGTATQPATAPPRAAMPIPTGPRFGVRTNIRTQASEDGTRGALAKSRADPELLMPGISAPMHSHPLGPPPLSARIGPPVPRGTSVDFGDRDARDDGDRRGGRDYRPYGRGRGRGTWRK